MSAEIEMRVNISERYGAKTAKVSGKGRAGLSEETT